MDEIKELIRLQQKPKIHIGVEEKIPTVQYGNKTYTINVSFHVDSVDKDAIISAIRKVNEVIKQSKIDDGIIKIKPDDKKAEAEARKFVDEAFGAKEKKQNDVGESIIDKLMGKHVDTQKGGTINQK